MRARSLLFCLMVLMSFSCERVGNVDISTEEASEIGTDSAVLHGTVKVLDGEVLTMHGFVYSLSQDPTVNDELIDLGSRSDLGEFQAGATGLESSSTYYFRAYGKGSGEVVYGETRSLKTQDILLPSLSIVSHGPVKDDSVTIQVEITDNGGGEILSRGVCWGETFNPTVVGAHTEEAVGDGVFYSRVVGLQCARTYYVRAYASNHAGLKYSDQISVETGACGVALPSVSTEAVSNVTESAATSGGNVTDEGGGTVSARGVCYSTSSGPTTSDNLVPGGAGAGSFVSELTGLSSDTDYYIRAYATNEAGTEYGDELQFRTDAGDIHGQTGTLTDIDGNTYNWIGIGKQVWMAENLKTTRYSDKSNIPLVEGTSAWAALDGKAQAYCWYENSTTNRDLYGGLYTWAAAVNGTSGSSANPSGIQGVCPEGWHLPSDAEWKELEMYLGMSQIEADGTEWRGKDEGSKLKEAGTKHWVSPNEGATNSSGFTALPGGYRFRTGSFYNLGEYTSFWTATAYDGSEAWYRSLYNDHTDVDRYYYLKYFGRAVRCVRD